MTSFYRDKRDEKCTLKPGNMVERHSWKESTVVNDAPQYSQKPFFRNSCGVFVRTLYDIPGLWFFFHNSPIGVNESSPESENILAILKFSGDFGFVKPCFGRSMENENIWGQVEVRLG